VDAWPSCSVTLPRGNRRQRLEDIPEDWRTSGRYCLRNSGSVIQSVTRAF
jgi:hypothetical protein